MRFSIVIPVYNVAEYLRACVDSVLANDCSDCEIILVDDGSTDGVCPALCDQIAAEHPEFIRVIHQENRGLGGARNTGLEAAKGEYLFFVDSDDTIAPDSLTVLSEAIEKTNADIYSFHMYSHDGAGNHSLIRTSQEYEGAFSLRERPQFLFALPTACSRIWRREMFLSTGIRYPSRVWYEDIRTSAKLFASANSIVTLPHALYWYLARPGSIVRSANVERNREILDAFDDILGWFEVQGLRKTYEAELTRLAVDHIVLAASVRVARLDPRHPLLKEFSQYMDKHFPRYRSNPHNEGLSGLHKLLLKLIEGRHYRLIQLLFRLKDRNG